MSKEARAKLTAPDGTQFRDLNHNGLMEPYENPTLPVEARVADLLRRMTLEEKVGQLFHDAIETGPGGVLVEDGGILMQESTTHVVTQRHMTHFNLLQMPEAHDGARWQNNIQRVAASTRLGIPITVSSDPRHSSVENVAATLASGSFSTWPEALGLAALQDPDAVYAFAQIARQEYLAVGIRSALHPQVDLATEPRWARQSTTFGPDAVLTSDYVRAYLRGFQDGTSLATGSVACMTKHFPGGGPQKDGEDPHFAYGREQVYPTGNFEYHLAPFVAAIDAGTSAIMPYYGMPVGLTYRGAEIEPVGFGFNRQVIDGILRERLGFDGVVCTDWQLVSDVYIAGRHLRPRAWGVEHLDRHARVQKILDAGCDQLGGEHCTDVLLDLVHDGRVSLGRIDESVRRLLRVKFELGLFDDPYVDENAVTNHVGTPTAVAAGLSAQVRSSIILQEGAALNQLATDSSTVVYCEALDPDALQARTTPTVADADIVVIRLGSPFDFRDDIPIESAFHAGTLAFSDDVIAHVRTLAERAPVIAEVTLDRPAVLTEVMDVADTVIGTFTVTDAAVGEVLASPGRATGRLPFDLPRDMPSVERSAADAPWDLQNPLFTHAMYQGRSA